jgi:hypothetical protein
MAEMGHLKTALAKFWMCVPAKAHAAGAAPLVEVAPIANRTSTGGGQIDAEGPLVLGA